MSVNQKVGSLGITSGSVHHISISLKSHERKTMFFLPMVKLHILIIKFIYIFAHTGTNNTKMIT